MAQQIVIRYDGVDISDRVLYRNASFTSQQSAVPGTFEITCKDLDRTDSYVTGKIVELLVDDVLLFGGYVTQVSRTFALPADIVPTETRQWVLRGVDYNILFDKRVVRDTANIVKSPILEGLTNEGELVLALNGYLDIPAGFDVTSEVDDVRIRPEQSYALQAGGLWRDELELIRQHSGALFYMTPTKHLRYVALESAFASWGFSDDPNGVTTIGPRDVDATEDAASMVNDALIWGGSELAGSDGLTSDEGGKIVFWREQAATSISTHGRWQRAETHYGEDGYKLDPADYDPPPTPDPVGVRTRAKRIVLGPPGTDQYGTGMKDPQWQVQLTWDAHRVPGNNHLWPGQFVSINLTTMGAPLSPMVLPLRSVVISFPAKTEVIGEAAVMFRGNFGLQLSDPWQIWAILRRRGGTVVRRTTASTMSTFNNASTSTTYGGLAQFTPIPAADGSATSFNLPVGGYIAGTLQVYREGYLLPSGGYAVLETSPGTGAFSIVPAPEAGDVLHVVCRTTTAFVSYVPQAGIVGFGRNTTGGASGTVYTVSTWAAFKSAVQASGARIIRFTAGSYTIDGAADHATMDDPNLTIDGTGWSGAFKRSTLNIRASNAYLTELRLRPGDDVEVPDDADCLSINSEDPHTTSVSNIVIDRCSLLWAPDVILAVLNNVTDVTVQYCMIGAGLRESTHSEAGSADPGHSYGGNVTTIGALDYDTVYGRRITFYRNYIFHNWTGRNIRGLYTDNIEYVNNVVYNWGRHLAHPNPRGGNFVGNMFKKGPGTPVSNEVFETETHGGSEDAYLNSVYWPTTGADANLGIGFTPTEKLEAGSRRTTLYRSTDNGAAVTSVATASEALADEVVAGAGPSVIDEVDQIFKDDWANDTGDYWNGASGPAPHPYWP